jgi:hypothetical protein
MVDKLIIEIDATHLRKKIFGTLIIVDGRYLGTKRCEVDKLKKFE